MTNKYKIYGKNGCPFCDKAKKLLTIKGLEFEYLTLNTDYTFEELLELAPAAKTFPQIFNGDRLIGGYVDLEDELD